MDTYVYQIGSNLYVNLTNRCGNRCTFCVRDQSAEYEGYSLWLKGGEPSVVQVLQKIGNPAAYREVVFCGYGEPTYRLKEMLEISEFVKDMHGKTRLNTNGHGNLINGRNIAPELAKHLDGVNISLNAPDEDTYNAVCRPQIAGAFEGMLNFARGCKAAGVNCWFSVVDCIDEDQLVRCYALADKIGIPLRVRKMIEGDK